MIIRSYSCLNRRCRHEFDSTGDFPPCPRCRGLRVQWVPKPVNINSARTASIDKTVRELAADFGMTNFRSPVAGQAAMPPPPVKSPDRAPPPDTPWDFDRQPSGGQYFEPQRGWRIKLPDAALQGQGHAVCAPTGVTSKIKVDPNAGALKPTNWGPERIRAATKIEGTYSARIPK